MQELTIQDLHDYANHFNALISRVRLKMPLDEELLMPHDFLRKKYPKKYQQVSYPPTFSYRRLDLVITYFNKQVEKTTMLLKRLLTIIGEIIYGDRTMLMGVI
jgi:hypothetical protein